MPSHISIFPLVVTSSWKTVLLTMLLSLLPLSSIVVSIGELANKHFFTISISSTNMTPTQAFILPTVSLSNNTGMDLFAGLYPDNYDKM